MCALMVHCAAEFADAMSSHEIAAPAGLRCGWRLQWTCWAWCEVCEGGKQPLRFHSTPQLFCSGSRLPAAQLVALGSSLASSAAHGLAAHASSNLRSFWGCLQAHARASGKERGGRGTRGAFSALSTCRSEQSPLKMLGQHLMRLPLYSTSSNTGQQQDASAA